MIFTDCTRVIHKWFILAIYNRDTNRENPVKESE